MSQIRPQGVPLLTVRLRMWEGGNLYQGPAAEPDGDSAAWDIGLTTSTPVAGVRSIRY